MAEPTRNYLAIFDINPATPARLQVVAPGIIEILREVARESPELAFRATNGDHFGFFIQTTLNVHKIRALIDSPKTSSPVLSGADRYLVLELGAGFAGHQGFSRATTWLQRHER